MVERGIEAVRQWEPGMVDSKKPASGKAFSIQVGNERGITIGQLVESVSQMVGQRCTPAMIYNYEKHGLLPPSARTAGGFRLFRVEDIQRVVCIKRMQAQGISLEAIREKIGTCSEEMKLTSQAIDLPVDRRTRILEAAAVVFPQKGYAATTLQDVAQEADVASSAIYQYFRNKEDLFLALTDNLSFIPILDEINRSLDEEKDLEYEDIRRSLIAVAEGFLDTHVHNLEILRMFLAEARSFPQVGRRYCERLVAPVDKLLERYLSRQMKRGVLRKVNVALAVNAFYGIFLNIIVTQNLLEGEGILHLPERNRVEQLIDIYLLGLVHPPVEEKLS